MKEGKEFDYKDNPKAYELEEHSRPDEMLMLSVARETIIKILNSRKESTVLDLCCGTGLSLEGIVDHPNVSFVTGVDISSQYLEFAQKKFSQCLYPPVLISGDAVSTPLPRKDWDVVILSSAYHHIENNRKVKFLNRVRSLISVSGIAVIAENILPEYELDNQTEYSKSVQQFYQEVLKTATEKNPELPNYVKNLINRVAQYGCDGEYEYKVSLSIFYQDLKTAKLRIVEQKKVWPDKNLLGTGGNYVFTVSN